MTTKRSSGDTGDAVPASMARIAADFAEAESVPVSLLGDYLQVLVAVAETGRRLTRSELEACCQHGEEAAGLGVPLRAVVDAYLTVTWQAWDQLPAARAAGTASAVRSVARAVLRAADDAAAALADGYERARRITVRREEARGRARTPIIACRLNPTWRGSVTATICMTSASMSFWTRCRTAASDSPTSRAIVTNDWRPSSWSSSTIRLDTASSGAVRVGILGIVSDDGIRRQVMDSQQISWLAGHHEDPSQLRRWRLR